MSRRKSATYSEETGKNEHDTMKRPLTQTYALAKKLTIVFLTLSIGGTLLFRYLTPPFSSVMAIQSVSPTVHNPAGKILQRWVPLSEISCHLIRAVTASEDQRFETHPGFDFEAIKSAFRHNQHKTSIRGGSTISQQTAKNLFLWHGRSFVRKGVEAYFTLLIEVLWPKKRIIEMYLNIIEMGDGIYGAEAAANTYFNKPASALTKAESALLAAILPSPKTRDPMRPSRHVQAKKNWILDQMARMPTTRLCK